MSLHSALPAAEAPPRRNDPEQTRRDIISVATQEFAASGLAGARIDRIAAHTKTSKRMIYYYFGSKEGLYLTVLEEAYRNLRRIEGSLKLEGLSAEEALRELVGFTFDHHVAHSDYVRLIAIENIHEGRHISKSRVIQELNVPAIEAARRIQCLNSRAARWIAADALRELEGEKVRERLGQY